MSKKNKRPTQETAPVSKTTKYPIPVPDIQNMDEVANYADEYLLDRLKRLEAEKNQLLELRCDSTPWEVELAYLQREQQMRQVRFEKHTQYMKDLDGRRHGYHDDDRQYSVVVDTDVNSISLLN
jgi:hypothetical protein